MSRTPTAKQLALPFKSTHGGRRVGAGRPNRSGKPGHLRRPALDRRHPLHVTLRLRGGLPSLRRREIFLQFRAAILKSRNKGLRIAQFAILSNHVHLILEPAEARGVRTTGRALQSLAISFAKRLNKHLGRQGPVFEGRYHQHVLRTPTEVKRALAYVLTNEAKHRGALEISIDPYSSAFAFRSWRELFVRKVRFRFTTWPEDLIEAWLAEVLIEPRTWLLTRGWQRGGNITAGGIARLDDQ